MGQPWEEPTAQPWEAAPSESADNGKEAPSYEGVPDENLNFLQKAERWMLAHGPSGAKQEALISPDALKSKQQVVEHAADTITGHHYPELLSAIKNAPGTLVRAALNRGKGLDTLKDNPAYISERDAIQQRLNEAPAQHKILGATTGIVPMLAANPTAAETALGRIAQAGGMGFGMGAAQDPGSTPGEVDPYQVPQRLWNGTKSAALNVALTAPVEGVIAAAEHGPALAKKGIAKASNWLTGIDNVPAAERAIDRPDVLKAYKDPMGHMEDTMETVKEKLTPLKDNVGAKQQALETANEDLRTGTQGLKEDLASAKPTVETEAGVGKSIEELRGTVNQLSKESGEIAAKTVIPKEELLNIIQTAKARHLVAGGAIGKGSKQALAELDALEADLANLPDHLGGDDVKKIIQRLDPSINYPQNAGGYMDASSQAYSDVRSGVDQYLKISNNEYAEKMAETEYFTKLLSQASKKFGNPETVAGRLSALASGNSSAQKSKDLLSAVEENTGGNYMSDVDRFIHARQTGASRNSFEQAAEQLPQAKAVESAQGELKAAEDAYGPFKKLDDGLQSKLSTASTGSNVENTNLVREFGETHAPELGDKVADMGAAKAFSGAVGPAGSKYGTRRMVIGGGSALLGGAGMYRNQHDPGKLAAYGLLAGAGGALVSPAVNLHALTAAGKVLNSGGAKAITSMASEVSPLANAVRPALEAATRNPGVNQIVQDYFRGKEEGRPAQPEERAQVQKNVILRKVQSTPYAAPLQKAAQNGDDAYAATYYMLYQNHDDFRSIIDDEDELD